jgi:microcystin-dependent protein
MGQSPGTSNYIIGQLGGSEEVTLNVNQIPSHNHPSASSNAATLGNAAEHVVGSGANAIIYSTNSPSVDYPAQALQTAGGSQSHNNMMPYQGIHFIIALEGIFPSQP